MGREDAGRYFHTDGCNEWDGCDSTHRIVKLAPSGGDACGWEVQRYADKMLGM